MQSAVDNLWRFTGELFQADELEIELSGARHRRVDPRGTAGRMAERAVAHGADHAGLQIPQEAAFRKSGEAGAAQRTSRAAAGGYAAFDSGAYPGQQW
ncbi:Phenylacetic acid catabolic protein [Shigella flexneri]